MLVFWEITRSCLLACRHCRASATAAPLPGELGHQEGMDMIDQVAGFGRPYPILVLTGGDCLLRDDVFELVAHATELGVPVCLSPSVTPMLTPDSIARMASSGVKAVSLSLDGSSPRRTTASAASRGTSRRPCRPSRRSRTPASSCRSTPR